MPTRKPASSSAAAAAKKKKPAAPTDAAAAAAPAKKASRATPAPAAAKKKPAAAATAKKKKPAAAAPAPAHRDSQDDSLYSDPALRHRLKDKVMAGDKGGKPGQWSARKSQLLAKEYESAGGAYTNKKPTGKQKDLQHWTKQDWQTADGKKAVEGKETARYLPKDAWDKLSPAQKKATDTKKRAASKKGEQFVPNTPAAKKARKQAG